MLNNKQSVFSLMKPTTLIILGIIVGILVISTIGFVVMLAKSSDDSGRATTNNVEANNIAPKPQAPVAGRKDVVIKSSDHLLGNPNASVKIVEFSDFECPFCNRHHPTLKQVMQEYGDQVAWIYKHFPLDSIHREARPAAEASECVAEQLGEEGFWNFTDAMFLDQNRLGSSFYEEVASSLGVNMSVFKDCVSSRKYQARVETDYQQGLSLGVTGTPGNYINGIEIKGAIPFNTIKQIIDSELN